MAGMRPILLRLAVLTGIARCFAGSGDAPVRPPNFVIVLADDLGYGDLGCYGNPDIRTPHLDALAAGGLRFTDFHASGPVCSPTRAGLLTGRYQQRAGIPGVINASPDVNRHHGLQSGEVTFAELLAGKGYRTGICGKWHLGYEPRYNPVTQGFGSFHGYVSGNIDYHSHVDRMGVPDWWNGPELQPESGYSTHLITRHALDFLEASDARPFCLYVAYEAPHDPYQGPNDPPLRRSGEVTPLRYAPGQIERAYREMVEEMDAGIGRIVTAIQTGASATNTLVFFCSDNGATPRGRNGGLRGFKGSLWEGGHRVPAIAWWPGRIAPGRTTDATAISLDVMPALLELAGLPAPTDRPLDGVSLTSLLFGRGPAPVRRLFWEYGAQGAVREGDWKLMIEKPRATGVAAEPGRLRLFNLAEDRGEARDLADRFPERTAALRTAWERWAAEVARDATLQPQRPSGE